MINRFFFLFSALVFLIGNTASGSASNSLLTHTQHTPIELKPAFLDPDNSYQTASVCFLGIGCEDDARFNKGGDYEMDTAQQCKNEGYTVTTCTSPNVLSGQCPYNENYYSKCVIDNDLACKNEGYMQNCSDGEIADTSQSCPYDASYKKCKCNPCDGYTYTYAQATAQGYVVDSSCQSCSETKYKRKNNPCSGFMTCECGGEVGAQTCQSGTSTLYKTCKSCCENKCTETECPAGNLCEFEACSNKYCITGCAINNIQWCTVPVTDCGALGYNKTVDDCHYGYLKCPFGDTVFCEEV